MIKISVIFVMFNEFEMIKKALSAVYEENISNMELILIDNSTDKQGYKLILKQFPKIKYTQNKKDIGFSRAVNIGLKKCSGEYILVLTPDMYILPGTIKSTIDYIKLHPDVGLVGCRVYSSLNVLSQSVSLKYPNIITQIFYYNMPIYKLIHRFFPNYHPTYVSLKEHSSVLCAKNISGAYMLLRRKAIENINYLDPQFFMYYDDYDLSKRLNDSGWKVIYLPVGGIVQNELAEWKNNIAIAQSYPFYMESLYKFYKKHYGIVYAFNAWIVAFLSSVISIPYLVFVSNFKKIIKKESQSDFLIPLWKGIIVWHFTKGLKFIL